MKKEIIKEIPIDADVMTKLERLHFEYVSTRDLVAFMVESHRTDTDFINSDIFKTYQSKLADQYKEYETFKNELAITFIPEDILLNGDFMWEADFARKLVIIEKIS